MKKGIDVSEYQGIIYWDQVKPQIDFAILRVGFGSDFVSQDDKFFKTNADACTRLGIPFGVYIYSYANSFEKVHSEVQHVLRLVKGYKLSLPVFYDMEDKIQSDIPKETLGEYAKIFCTEIENAGYKAGIYANTYWFNNKLTSPIFEKYDKWVAQYANTLRFNRIYKMWQYSSMGSVKGIGGNVDVNYSYYEEAKDMDKLVVYLGDADVFAAVMVAQKLRCPMMKLSDFKSSGLKAGEVIQIGGKAEDKDRFQTFKNAASLL